MKSVLRPTTPDDLNAIAAFLQRVFGAGADAPFTQSAVMHWKYWDPRGDWSEPRAYVLERNGAITAHAGLWPLVVNGVRGVHMIDWASSPDAPGAGLLLVQKFAAMFDFIIAIGGSDMTRTILPAYGFVEHTQQWTGARPLRPLRQIVTHQHKNWKLIPRLARNTMWSLGLPAPAGWKAEAIAPEQVEDPGSLAPRSAAFFRYLLACPVARVHFYRIREGGTPRGHFVLSVIRGQARLAGLWLREMTPASARAAYALAQAEAAKLEGANEFTAAGGAVTEQAARESGLRLTGEMTPVFLLNRKKNLALPPDFQFQLVEYDGFFLDTGSYSYLT
jgi:hypothetical protein